MHGSSLAPFGRINGWIRRTSAICENVSGTSLRHGSSRDRMEIIDGVAEILSAFREDGQEQVYALQYLNHRSPALGARVFEALRNGRRQRVLKNVRAVLGHQD